jgi:hypothetical protein
LTTVAEPVEIRDGEIGQVQPVALCDARVERAGAREIVLPPLDPHQRGQ